MSLFSKTESGVAINLPSPIVLWKKLQKALAEKRDLEAKLKVMTKFADQLAACHDDLVKTFGKETRCKALLKKHGFNS